MTPSSGDTCTDTIFLLPAADPGDGGRGRGCREELTAGGGVGTKPGAASLPKGTAPLTSTNELGGAEEEEACGGAAGDIEVEDQVRDD
jgi:hypothetical protein